MAEPSRPKMKLAIFGRIKSRIRRSIQPLLGGCLHSTTGYYQGIHLSPEDIASEAFKQHLGGGQEHWEQRGRFQLLFLKSMGLIPSSCLLDIGCGPLRAGVHLIDYLDAGHYIGFDYNADFVAAARSIVQGLGLTNKCPEVACISDFDCTGQNWCADFALAFSVLNHCSETERCIFFQRIAGALRAQARLYITHASWMRPSYLKSSGLEITKTIGSDFIDITRHGWEHPDDIFPILELTKIQDRSS